MFSIGSTTLTGKLLLAPIAGYCDLCFRLTIRSLGGLALGYTDLVNPRGLLRRTFKSMELIETEPADAPLAVQLYGHEADQMAEAARWCQDNLPLALIDINMGCPVDKVCKTNAGSALLRQPAEAIRLAESVVKAVRLPVTVKMRLGWDEHAIVAPQLAADLERAGVAAITVHGRTAAQAFRGTADWEGIARVVAAVQRIPVIGNGDVKSPQDAANLIARTGCAAVMIGRAALRDPWIFRDSHALLTTGVVPPPPDMQARIAFVRDHYGHLLRIRGERRACITFRQRLSFYLRMLGSPPGWRHGFQGLYSTAHFETLMAELPQELTPAGRPD